MKKSDVIVLGLSGGYEFSPVQVQKLFFLIDKNVPQFSGKFFDFTPYDYGPFDKTVYEELELLSHNGLVEILADSHASKRVYKLSRTGQKKALEIAKKQSDETVKYTAELSDFVRGLTFRELVSAIYKAYPDMRTNSIFFEK